MKISDKKSIQELTLAMVALGLKNAVIAPGSRNAPLTISFNQHPQINCISIRDERSAGFFALGMAVQLREPVAIICSSGSATVNFSPAIVEAFYLRVPLIVITADRPEEWIDQGDGQTIRQSNIYNNFIRKSYDLNGETSLEDKLWYNRRRIAEGFSIALHSNPGPVHFNVPLNEPLYNTLEHKSEDIRLFTQSPVNISLAAPELEELQNIFSSTKKVMVLAGQNLADKKTESLLKALAAFDNVIVLCESTSNINSSEFINNIDRVIMPLKEDELMDFCPELLISLGAAIVSKKIKEILRKNQPRHHWNVHPQDYFTDTFASLSKAIPLRTAEFLEQFLDGLPKVNSEYKNLWINRAGFFQEKHQEFVRNVEFSDFYAFYRIFEFIPKDTNLHLANSSPIRYAQLFNGNEIKSTHSNRGTSGIDGSTSTAAGAAFSDPENPYLLISGDIAFFYDNNAFWNEKWPENLKIIIINNSGGGIFRIVKGPAETEELEEFFETKQNRSAKGMVEFYGCEYISANDPETLETALKSFFEKAKKKIVLEIFTPNELNPKVLKSYFSHLETNAEN